MKVLANAWWNRFSKEIRVIVSLYLKKKSPIYSLFEMLHHTVTFKYLHVVPVYHVNVQFCYSMSIKFEIYLAPNSFPQKLCVLLIISFVKLFFPVRNIFIYRMYQCWDVTFLSITFAMDT